MKKLYTPFDIALFFASANLTISEEQSILVSLWQHNNVIDFEYCKGKKQFRKSVFRELDNLIGVENVFEIDLIFKDMGSKFSLLEFNSEQDAISSFFKVIKLNLTHAPGKNHCRIKLRNLIKNFGYKKRSAALIDNINSTISSLDLTVCLRGRKPCNINTVPLDNIIVIRLNLVN